MSFSFATRLRDGSEYFLNASSRFMMKKWMLKIQANTGEHFIKYRLVHFNELSVYFDVLLTGRPVVFFLFAIGPNNSAPSVSPVSVNQDHPVVSST